MILKMFKAQRQTKRFKLNQKVWIIRDSANHAYVRYKYRGNGRYVTGRISKWHPCKNEWSTIIGKEGFKEIEVTREFANRMLKGI